MKISYSFSSSQGDVPVDESTLARPFIVRPFQEHSFITLEDYFFAIRDFILGDDASSLIALLGRLWEHKVETSDLDAVAIRYEKYGTLYHISSVEITAGLRRTRFSVSTAVTDESKEALEREFNLLQPLYFQASRSYLPEVYWKRAVQIRKAEGSEILLMTLSEWFDNYHEWHFSKDRESKQRVVVWDMESGYRYTTKQETCELIRQATAILTFYYDTQTYYRIFPWHHGAGDFVVKVADGNIDVKLIAARGYEPVPLSATDIESGPSRAGILFLLETTVKMRLDKYEGMGESTWADAAILPAVVDGFIENLKLKASGDDTRVLIADEIIKQLKSFTEEDLRGLLLSRIDQFRSGDPSDYTVVLSRLDEHARELYQVLQQQANAKKADEKTR